MGNVKKIKENIYQLDKEGKMNVPVVVYASEKLLKDMEKDKCIEQAKNVAMLPGIQKYSIVLPDAHQGYGFCIGGVAAFSMDEGIISPGGVGYDINCSVRLLRTNLKKSDVIGKNKDISKALYKSIPSGTGKGTKIKLTKSDMINILENGAKWAIENNMGNKEDLEYCEENACMKEADSKFVSQAAISRGINQLGSIGSGNHFVEIQYVDKIFDKKTAEIFGLKEDQVVIMIHCGSRGLGHQVASDYIKKMDDIYGHDKLPDRQLACAPVNSDVGKEYYKAMCAAANFAFCNKQVLTHLIRKCLSEFFPKFEAEVVYDVCHNIAKFEEHSINCEKVRLCVHRKGATRSLGPGRKEIPKKYLSVGQPVLIPGSMGTSSYVLVGTKEAEELSFSSTAHGAGRVMSRSEALRKLNREKILSEMEDKNIALTAGSFKGLVEEAPEVYKDVDEVVKVSDELKIGKLVSKLKPIAVIKG